MEMTADSSRLFHVVAIPYPGRGHINPMLNLCRHIATADHLTVTVVVTEDWLSLLSPSTTTNLRFACIPNVLPLERDRGADPFGFVEAVRTRMGPTTEELLRRLQPPAEAIVADSFLPWVEGLSERIKVPATALFTQSASMFLAVNQLSGSD